MKSMLMLLVALLTALLVAGCAPSPQAMLNEGNAAFAAGDYALSMEHYQAAREGLPDAAEPLYNMANVDYRQENAEAARALLRQAAELADPALAQHAYYNLGGAAAQAQDTAAAIEAYRQALRLNPADQDAKHNLELMMRMQAQEDQEQQQDEQQTQPDEQSQQEQPSPQDAQQGEPSQAQSSEDEQEQGQQEGEGEPRTEPTPAGGDPAQAEQPQDGTGEPNEEQQGEQGDPLQDPQQPGAQPEPTQQPADEAGDEAGNTGEQGEDGAPAEEAPQPQSLATPTPIPQTGGTSGGEGDDQPQEPDDSQFGQGAGQQNQNDESLAAQPDAVSRGEQRLTEEEARQLLAAVGQRTRTLQEYLQQFYVPPDRQGEQDW